MWAIKHRGRFSLCLGLFSLVMLVSCGLFLYAQDSYVVEFYLSSVSSVDVSLAFLFDWVSSLFSFHVLIISFSVFWFAAYYMKEDVHYYRFMWILLLFVISMNILVFSSSLFILLLGWDGLGVTSFVLIIYYDSKQALWSGFLTLMINRLGDILIIGSLLYFLSSGSWMTIYMPWLGNGLALIIVFAAMTKSAQFPFSSWLPAAMAAPTPVSALVHSSTLVTAGVYLVIRLSMMGNISEVIMKLCLWCGVVTSLLGGMAAMVENDLKKIIALSTLSQLGVMFFSLGLQLPYLTLFHLLAHASFKAMLFLCAGVVLMMSFGVQDLRLLGGIGRNEPLMLVFFNVSNFCLMALPFLNAFFTKHSILECLVASQGNSMLWGLMLIASFLTSVYSLRLMKCLSWDVPKMVCSSSCLPPLLYGSFMLMLIGSIVSGKIMSGLVLDFQHHFLFAGVSWWLMMLLVPLAVMVIAIMPSYNNRSWLASMWFLTPISYKTRGGAYLLSSMVGKLDYGWLEPQVVLKHSMLMISVYINNLFVWPSTELNGFLKGGVVMMGVICLWYYIL